MAGSGSGNVKLASVMLLICAAMVMVQEQAEAAITCGHVIAPISPCFGYLRTEGPLPAPCCNGIRSLKNAVKSTPDRRTACRCLRSVAASMTGIDTALAASLPGKCGVHMPYKITRFTDCTKII